MFGRTIKIAIFFTAFVLILSLVFPAGCGISFHNEKSQVTPPGFTKPRESMESLYHPILTVDDPKMYYMISDGEGNGILVDLPQNMNKEEIEDRIKQKIIEESHVDGTIGENVNGKDDMSEAVPPHETTSLEDSEKYIVLTNWMSEDYLDGHLFCNVNEMLNFDISSLFSSYNLKKCEWDFDGDGNYNDVCFSPTHSHKYTTIGLYEVYLRITYSYNYSYYPIYFEIDNVISNPINISDDILLTASVRKGNDAYSISGVVQSNWKYYLETENITPSFVEYQNIVEYTIKVSVGSEETGYPPILDLELNNVVEERELREGQDDAGLQVRIPFPPIWIQTDFPYGKSQNIGNVHSIEADNSSKAPIIYVKVKDIENEKVSYFENCQVEFDASKTRDINQDTVFIWDFGDSKSGEGTQVTHIFNYRGTYRVTLSAKGWDYSISKTIVLLRGSEDPNVVILKNYYKNPRISESYLFCNLDEPMIFDISELVSWINLLWVEWDFDGDGIFEENVTTSWITKTFCEPGYYEVGFRYTYLARIYTILIADRVSNSEEAILSHSYHEYCTKVIVKSEDNSYPLIPDFTTRANSRFGWWNLQWSSEDYQYVTEQKDITYLRFYSPPQNTINTWGNPVTFSANSTVLPEGKTYNDFFYFWDFGEGETATGLDVTHEFEDVQKDYPVKLTVWNQNYHLSVIKTVNPRPISPNIYLYRENSDYDTIRIIVDGRVTKAIPEVDLGPEIVWKDVFIEDGKLYCNGNHYDFLYYEELLNEPKTSNYGWILEKDEEGNLFLDGKLMNLEELKDFFRIELTKAGLFKNEIEDFIEEWLGEGARLFPGQKPFHYAIMYIPENIVDDIIQIETDKEYDEIIRVHFLIQQIEEDIHLVPPRYPDHVKGKNILHEWGVYFDNSISEKENDNGFESWVDILMDGHNDLQMCTIHENRIGSLP